jgi:hypothetical protein
MVPRTFPKLARSWKLMSSLIGSALEYWFKDDHKLFSSRSLKSSTKWRFKENHKLLSSKSCNSSTKWWFKENHKLIGWFWMTTNQITCCSRLINFLHSIDDKRRHEHKLTIYLLVCRIFPSLKYDFKPETKYSNANPRNR